MLLCLWCCSCLCLLFGLDCFARGLRVLCCLVWFAGFVVRLCLAVRFNVIDYWPVLLCWVVAFCWWFRLFVGWCCCGCDVVNWRCGATFVDVCCGYCWLFGCYGDLFNSVGYLQ